MDVSEELKVTPGFCKRLATGRCYIRIDNGYFTDHASSTGSNPCQHEICNTGAIQRRFVSGNNADLIECGLGRGVVAWCSGLEMMGNRSNVVSSW